MFDDKTLLITGGTGSFGNAVIKRFLGTNIKEIRIFSRDEKKQDDMRGFYQDERLKFYVGDVRDYNSIHCALTGVDYLFHAAALKQVPSCEFFPIEAVKTNVLGTENVLSAAIAQKVNRAITLSTDKAVYPVNAMGMSKAMMEKVMIAKSRNVTDGQVFCGTRYGNVIASRGSVIPKFIEQIKNGQEITITDPTMTRFIMSLDSAVDLVIYAFENGNPGDIFVHKAPACTIGDLAQALLKMFDADNVIRVIGTRHGEKHYETLLNREEMVRAQELGDYYRIQADGRGLNYDQYFSSGEERISGEIDYASNTTQLLNIDEIIHVLLKIDSIRESLDRG